MDYCTLQVRKEQSKAFLDYFKSLTFSRSFKVKVRSLTSDDLYVIFMLTGVSFPFEFESGVRFRLRSIVFIVVQAIVNFPSQ